MVDRLAGDKVSRTFCTLPWVHRFTNIGGEHQVCCTAEEFHPAIPDADGTPLSVANCQDDQRIMNVPFMKDLRRKMLAGEWHPICERCRLSEAGGNYSRRNFENERHADLVDELVISTAEDGAIPVHVRSVDFRLGNLCNLACRMCNPRSSSRWIPEWNKIDHGWFGMRDEDLKAYKSFEWYKNPAIWENFKEQIPNLRHLHFAGGEPLLIPEMAKVLEACVASGDAGRIELTYNTNITRIPGKLRELWPHFQHVRILASIDGFGELNELIRYPSRWSVIAGVLRDLEENFDRLGLSEVNVMTTVQAYNVMGLDPLYEYLATHFERVCPLPHLINLYHPHYLRTQALPAPLKAIARERLMRTREKAQARFDAGRSGTGRFGPRYEHVVASIDGALHFMDAEDQSHLFPTFLRIAGEIDQVRGQDIFRVIPELREAAGAVRSQAATAGRRRPRS